MISYDIEFDRCLFCGGDAQVYSASIRACYACVVKHDLAEVMDK